MAAVLGYAADALWIIALSIMAGASRQAWPRIAPGTPVPLALGLSAPRAVALSLLPGVGLVLGLGLLAARPQVADSLPGMVILFSVRSTAAALFALGHLRWLSRALQTLATRGQLKP